MKRERDREKIVRKKDAKIFEFVFFSNPPDSRIKGHKERGVDRKCKKIHSKET